MTTPRILVAGIGNIFLGDDGFGVAVAQRLLRRQWAEGVDVKDFGIRSFDLAYALMDDYDLSILIDAMQRGKTPGTVFVIEADLTPFENTATAEIETHTMDPVAVLRLTHALGGHPKRILVVGCEPETFGGEEGQMELSATVEAALEEAEHTVELIVAEALAHLSESVPRPKGTGL